MYVLDYFFECGHVVGRAVGSYCELACCHCFVESLEDAFLGV